MLLTLGIIRDYTGLVSKIGIHFQVRDDYMNLQSQQVLVILIQCDGSVVLTSSFAHSMPITKAFVKTWLKANSHSQSSTRSALIPITDSSWIFSRNVVTLWRSSNMPYNSLKELVPLTIAASFWPILKLKHVKRLRNLVEMPNWKRSWICWVSLYDFVLDFT